MLLGTSAASILENELKKKGVIRVGQTFHTASSFKWFWNAKILSK